MDRKEVYGESLRIIKEAKEEIEQRQADLDVFEEEIEAEYAKVIDQQETLRGHQAECDEIKTGLTNEMRRYNPLHPSLNAQQTLHRDMEDGGRPEEALLVKLLPPRVEWDEKNDRACVTLHYTTNGNTTECEIYAMSLGQLDYIDETVLEGYVKGLAEHINRELWKTIKERSKNG